MFIYSLVLNQFALSGDQTHYRKVYAQIGGMSIVDAFEFYKLNLDSIEIVHFIFSFLSSKIGIPKDIYISFINSLLVYVFARIMLKLNVSKLVILLLVFSSFYLNVLYFSAERLKFGFLFLFLSILFLENKKSPFLPSFFSVISHVQMLVIYSAIIFASVVRQIKRFLNTGFISVTLLIIFIFTIFFSFFVADHIIAKVNYYSVQNGLLGMIKIIIITIPTLYYAKNERKNVLYIIIPILIAGSIVGAERIVILVYFIFLYYALRVKRGWNLGVMTVSAVTAIKSKIFIFNLILHGNGFYAG